MKIIKKNENPLTSIDKNYIKLNIELDYIPIYTTNFNDISYLLEFLKGPTNLGYYYNKKDYSDQYYRNLEIYKKNVEKINAKKIEIFNVLNLPIVIKDYINYLDLFEINSTLLKKEDFLACGSKYGDLKKSKYENNNYYYYINNGLLFNVNINQKGEFSIGELQYVLAIDKNYIFLNKFYHDVDPKRLKLFINKNYINNSNLKNKINNIVIPFCKEENVEIVYEESLNYFINKPLIKSKVIGEDLTDQVLKRFKLCMENYYPVM